MNDIFNLFNRLYLWRYRLCMNTYIHYNTFVSRLLVWVKEDLGNIFELSLTAWHVLCDCPNHFKCYPILQNTMELICENFMEFIQLLFRHSVQFEIHINPVNCTSSTFLILVKLHGPSRRRVLCAETWYHYCTGIVLLCPVNLWHLPRDTYCVIIIHWLKWRTDEVKVY